MSLFVFYDDQKDTEITINQKINMLHIQHSQDHENYYLEEIRNYTNFNEKIIYIKNPYFEETENIFLNVICPFWKFSEINKVRGTGSFIFWDDLPIFQGIFLIKSLDTFR